MIAVHGLTDDTFARDDGAKTLAYDRVTANQCSEVQTFP